MQREQTLEAIIFDMDGVLVDTEIIDYRAQTAFVQMLNEERGAPMQIDCASLVGKSYAALYEEISRLTGSNTPVDELRRRFDAYERAAHANIDYAALFRRDVLGLIAFAREQGMRLAVASSSERAQIERVLGICGVLDAMDAIESGEDVRESKPHPEIYERALARLGTDASRTLAIEDSTPGITAAKAAGLRVIGYRETRMPVDQSGADWIVDDFAGALGIVRRLV